MSVVLARRDVRMAELLMKSAIPNEGSIRTSWPALRNDGWANELRLPFAFFRDHSVHPQQIGNSRPNHLPANGAGVSVWSVSC